MIRNVYDCKKKKSQHNSVRIIWNILYKILTLSGIQGIRKTVTHIFCIKKPLQVVLYHECENSRGSFPFLCDENIFF